MLRRSLRRRSSSRKQLLQLAHNISSILRIILIMLLIVIVVSQIALQNNTIRHWLTGVDRWEGARPELTLRFCISMYSVV